MDFAGNLDAAGTPASRAPANRLAFVGRGLSLASGMFLYEFAKNSEVSADRRSIRRRQSGAFHFQPIQPDGFANAVNFGVRERRFRTTLLMHVFGS